MHENADGAHQHLSGRPDIGGNTVPVRLRFLSFGIVYWDRNAISLPGLASVVHLLITAARGVLFVMNMVFIITCLGALLSNKLRQYWALNPFHWLVAGAVWATSILSSILDHGDNPRFLIPLQSWVVFWVLWVGYTSWRTRHEAENRMEI